MKKEILGFFYCWLLSSFYVFEVAAKLQIPRATSRNSLRPSFPKEQVPSISGEEPIISSVKDETKRDESINLFDDEEGLNQGWEIGELHQKLLTKIVVNHPASSLFIRNPLRAPLPPSLVGVDGKMVTGIEMHSGEFLLAFHGEISRKLDLDEKVDLVEIETRLEKEFIDAGKEVRNTDFLNFMDGFIVGFVSEIASEIRNCINSFRTTFNDVVSFVNDFGSLTRSTVVGRIATIFRNVVSTLTNCGILTMSGVTAIVRRICSGAVSVLNSLPLFGQWLASSIASGCLKIYGLLRVAEIAISVIRNLIEARDTFQRIETLVASVRNRNWREAGRNLGMICGTVAKALFERDRTNNFNQKRNVEMDSSSPSSSSSSSPSSSSSSSTGKRGVPANWTCSPDYYDTFDGCDCNCGIPDPDCNYVFPVFGCGSISGSSLRCIDGQCVTGPSPPPQWTCNATYYNSTDGCDCGCGALDPDCELNSIQTFYCNGTQPDNLRGCSNGVCVKVTIPPEWNCSASFYDAGDGCDCNCGIRDPDCDIPWQTIWNCRDGEPESCSASGSCVYYNVPTAPEGWECPTIEYNDGSICNCGCGTVVDPDCSLPDAVLSGCPCPGMTCGASGLCEGDCNGFVIRAMTQEQWTATQKKPSSNAGLIAGLVIGWIIVFFLVVALIIAFASKKVVIASRTTVS